VKTNSSRPGLFLALTAAVICNSALTGCQTTIGGQTMPSADYLADDVQFFPAGPEFPLTNQVEASRKQEAAAKAIDQDY
jgi:outer membrane murein-binding lipoprotein Lpp